MSQLQNSINNPIPFRSLFKWSSPLGSNIPMFAGNGYSVTTQSLTLPDPSDVILGDSYAIFGFGVARFSVFVSNTSSQKFIIGVTQGIRLDQNSDSVSCIITCIISDGLNQKFSIFSANPGAAFTLS